MKITKRVTTQPIMCMANVRGKKVKNPHSLPFSFYFSNKNFEGSDVSHSIRVKPMFNPEKLVPSLTGTLKLSDDWEYIPGSDDKHVSKSDVKKMKQFFLDNIVLFCAVWDGQLQDSLVQEYFMGNSDLQEVIEGLDFYDEYAYLSDDNGHLLYSLTDVRTVKELDKFCRKYDLVNFYGN